MLYSYYIKLIYYILHIMLYIYTYINWNSVILGGWIYELCDFIYLFCVSYGWSVWPVICYLKVKVCVLINKSFWISSTWSFCCASVIRVLLSFFLLLLFPITRLLLSNLCGFPPISSLVCLASWLQVPWFKSVLWCLGVPRYDC